MDFGSKSYFGSKLKCILMETALSLFWLSCLKQKKNKSLNRAFGYKKGSDGFKQKERRFSLDRKKTFFVLRMVRPLAQIA